MASFIILLGVTAGAAVVGFNYYAKPTATDELGVESEVSLPLPDAGPAVHPMAKTYLDELDAYAKGITKGLFDKIKLQNTLSALEHRGVGEPMESINSTRDTINRCASNPKCNITSSSFIAGRMNGIRDAFDRARLSTK